LLISWIVLDSWKSNIFVNYSVWFVLLDFWSQFFTSHAIFNFRAYTQWVDRIIFYKISSFSIRDVASWGALPMPHTFRPNICNSCSEANLTKINFGNGGHCFATITSFTHSYSVLARARLIPFDHFVIAWLGHFPRCKHSF